MFEVFGALIGPGQESARDVGGLSAIRGRQGLSQADAEIDAETALHDVGGAQGNFTIGQAGQVFQAADGRLTQRRLGLFRIPEETDPPMELRELHAFQEAALAKARALPAAERDGFVRAVVDPLVNALHRGLLRRRRTVRAEIRAYRAALVMRAIAEGPGALTERERRILLMHDPDSVEALHERVWALGDVAAAARWGRPGTTPMPTA